MELTTTLSNTEHMYSGQYDFEQPENFIDLNYKIIDLQVGIPQKGYYIQLQIKISYNYGFERNQRAS